MDPLTRDIMAMDAKRDEIQRALRRPLRAAPGTLTREALDCLSAAVSGLDSVPDSKSSYARWAKWA